MAKFGPVGSDAAARSSLYTWIKRKLGTSKELQAGCVIFNRGVNKDADIQSQAKGFAIVEFAG